MFSTVNRSQRSGDRVFDIARINDGQRYPKVASCTAPPI